MTFPPKVWDGVLHRLGGELPAYAVDAWLHPLVADSSADDGDVHDAMATLILRCPSVFHLDRVRDNYLAAIQRCAIEVAGREISVELAVAAEVEAVTESAPLGGSLPTAELPRTAPLESTSMDAPLQPLLDPGADIVSSIGSDAGAAPMRAMTSVRSTPMRRLRSAGPRASLPRVGEDQHTFENFVVGSCNALAREACFAIAHSQQLSLNQVYLLSEPGLGKTHLARAVVREARRSGAAKPLYCSAEGFTNEFTRALRSKELEDFKRRYRRDCDVLIVENVDFFEGKPQTQLEFFHTIEHVLDAGGRILLSGARLPRRLSGLESRVRDRLASGFVAELEAPDAQVRREILRAKAAAGGVGLPGECLDLLVDEVRGSVRDLEGVLIQLVTTASLLKRRIDLDLTREALDKKCGNRAPERNAPDPELVMSVVSRFFKTSIDALRSRSRRRDALVPRQLAMYLCRQYTDASLAEIGRAMNRDHPSVSNAIKKIEREMLERAKCRYQVEALSQRLEETINGSTDAD